MIVGDRTWFLKYLEYSINSFLFLESGPDSINWYYSSNLGAACGRRGRTLPLKPRMEGYSR